MDSIDTVRVIAKPNPFKDEVLTADIEPGMSLREIIGNDSNNFLVNKNGLTIPHSDWSSVFAEDDDIIIIYRVPTGDGDEIVRLLAIVAVIVFAYWAGPALASSALPGTEAFWTSALMFTGMIVVSLLLPPTGPEIDNGERKRLFSLTGTRNQFAPFTPLPILYGKHRLYPPIASVPYTEVVGEDQYLNMIYCIGIGDYDISSSDVKIGETLATDYEDIEISITDQPTQPDIFEDQLSITFDQDATPGDSNTRATAADTEQASLDFVLPGGLIKIDRDGDKKYVEIHFEIEFRETGSSDPWVNVLSTNWANVTRGINQVLGGNATSYPTPSTASAGSITVSDVNSDWFKLRARTRDPFRVGLKFPFPSAGTWDVRVTRQRTELNGSAIDSTFDVWSRTSAQFIWTALRSYQPGNAVLLPANTATFLTMRVRATDQLNGVVDSLNVVATRKLRSWDKVGQTFNASAATRSPAWAFLDILTGLGNARPIESADEEDLINLDALADWADNSDINGLYYDEVIDYSTSVFDALSKVASVGRAALSNRDGKWTVIEEQAGGTYVQYFTPRNSWGFSATKRFVDYPHALKVRFNSDQDGYRETEIIVYDDGYNAGNATKFEVLELSGVTDYDQAWKTARYTMAAVRLRPEIFTFDADVEHIIAQRGDHILMSHDIPLWGTVYGRITAIDGNEVTIDEYTTLDGGTDYVMRVRLDDGTSVIEDLVNQGGSTNTHTFTPSIPAGIKVGDLVMVGEVGSETQELVVIGIEPSTDLSARVTCVEHNAAILTADTGSIPAYTPNITLPADIRTVKPVAPFNVQATSGDNVQDLTASGAQQSRIVVTWDLVGDAQGRWTALFAELRYREYDSVEAGPGVWKYIPTFNAFSAAVAINGADFAVEYEIQMRTRTEWNQVSPWTSSVIHTAAVPAILPDAPNAINAVGAFGGVSVEVNLTGVESTVAAAIEIAFGTVNDRDDAGTQFIEYAIPSNIVNITEIPLFVSFNDTTERYFWARIVDVYGLRSTWEPLSTTGGDAATPLGSLSETRYYIKPTQGTAIKNGAGQLTLEARQVDNGSDSLLSSGTIQLFDESDNVVNVANGYVTGSDGYTGILDAGDINGDIVITLKDGAGGTPLDTITLVDVDDGAPGGDGDDAVYGYIEPENGLVWNRPDNESAWVPAQLTTDLDVTFVQGGVEVARVGYRLTIDDTTGNITGATTAHPSGDLNSGRVTPAISGSGTENVTVTFTYSFGGDDAVVAENVFSVTGGLDGVDGFNSAVAVLYQRTNTLTAPTSPSADITYTFSSGNMVGITQGWSTTVPNISEGKYLWQIQALAYAGATADTIESGDWSPPVRQADTPLQQRILDTKDWLVNDPITANAGDMGVWDRFSGDDARAEIDVDVAGPFGGSPKVYQTRGNGSATDWLHALRGYHEYDKDQSYIYHCWAKRETNTASRNGLYCGFWADAGTDERVEDLAGTPSLNPYFVSDRGNEMDKSQWYLAVGVIHANGYTGADTGVAGLYDPRDGKRVYDGQEWRWVSTQYDDNYFRIGFYETSVAPSAGEGFDFTGAVAYVMDGSEPSVESVLFAGAPPPYHIELEASNGVGWTRAKDAGAWSPAGTTTDLDVTVYRNGVAVAREAIRLTLDTGTGTISASSTAHKDGDLNTSDITQSQTGDGTAAVTRTFTYTSPENGAILSQSQVITAVQGGDDGSPGDPGDDGTTLFRAEVFIRSASTPTTPTVNDGSYNFDTGVLTPPSGASVEPPSGADPLYSSYGTFQSNAGGGGTDNTVTWSAWVKRDNGGATLGAIPGSYLLTDVEVAPNSATTGIRVDTDGDIYTNEGGSWVSADTWLDVGDADDFDVMMTADNNIDITGTEDEWLQVSSDRSWVNTSSSDRTFQGTLYFRRRSDNVVVATVKVLLTNTFI